MNPIRIIAKDARCLSYDDLRRLRTFVEYDALSWWDGFDAQGMLDVYHACGDWDGVAAWLSNDNPERLDAHRIYLKIHRRCRQRFHTSNKGQET